ncbi:CHASE2 domain-containing protein [Leptolyngbya sp. FACHB-671]|uniref:CHASE2 domain-containing protein n=1 Tax=Leptolyngbya sp. FACHB-671 TaxID=2692812 RepID=UPI001683CDBE|nr:CHASE2 domain-containing protein [Leptolyngbya sp. FACHB-671]MBD2069531.1 CHASE2 domain-containing protein [Leptolyngbya sp. FACHB-671]
MASASQFHLKIQRIEQTCLFELTWKQGLRLAATMNYPAELSHLFQEWQRLYIEFYNKPDISLAEPSPETPLRGRVAERGVITSQTDWHAQLVQAEAKLLYEFHRWLRREELYEMRTKMAEASRKLEQPNQLIDLFLTCTPIDLARLPWEAWELSTECKVRIARTPATIQAEPVRRDRTRRTRPRILAIIGGFEFQADRAAVRSLSRLAEVQFVGWQPGQSIEQVKTQITQAIADDRGWDVLFFGGHSNETQITGGELAIAPHTSIQIQEIAPQLAIAQAKGLQFALFNSCKGLQIAESLIELGLSQVAVMREPIHNRVAQEFLVQFFQGLAAHKDVHVSLIEACQWLEVEKSLTYPSAFLVPSLFRHPESPLFCIERSGWKERWMLWRPTRYEAIGLTLFMVLGLSLPVQNWLLQRRVLVQTFYRQLLQPAVVNTPPVLLVQIDDESIQKAGVADHRPMDRAYLAQLVDRLTALGANVIGVDYLLDYPQPANDQRLTASIQRSLQQGTTFVFATAQDNNGNWIRLIEGIEQFESLKGDIGYWGTGNYAVLLSSDQPHLPFFYGLARLHQERVDPALSTLSGQSSLNSNLCSLSSRMCAKRITYFSYMINQLWLHPVVDYSTPPDQVYQRISAWAVLQPSIPLTHLSEQVVIIAPGGYADAGIKPGEDNFTPPTAMQYWYDLENPTNPARLMTGGELHAYLIHHALNQRFVVPIPDVWMMGLVAIAAKGITLLIQSPKAPRQRQRLGIWFAGSTVLYAVISLQLYASSLAVLLPIALPSGVLWMYVLPLLIKRRI